MHIMRLVLPLAVGLIVALASLASAQQRVAQGATAQVYVSQFVSLHDMTKALIARAAAARSREERLGLQERSLALKKLIHRLQEEAMRSNLDFLKPDRTLLLVIQGCSALDFALLGADAYLDTADSTFLRFANDGNGLVEAIRRLM